MIHGGDRAGLTTGDVLLALAGMSIILALAYPWMTDARLRRRADDIAEQVEAVRAAAVRYREVKGAWPPNGEAGQVPAELRAFVPADVRMSGEGHEIEWNSWETVTVPNAPETIDVPSPNDAPPRPETLTPPPPVFGQLAGVTVLAGNAHLLGLLLQRFGEDRSFVRDSSWTLLVSVADSVR